MSDQSIVVSYREIGKGFCPYLIQPFISIVKRSRNDGSRKLIYRISRPHIKGRSSPLAMALTPENVAEVLS